MATDRLSTIFAALADPTRRAILARLADGDATVTELAEPFPISLPAISRHLKVLEQAGLISRSRSAQWRSSSLQPEPLREATTRFDSSSRASSSPSSRASRSEAMRRARASGPRPRGTAR